MLVLLPPSEGKADPVERAASGSLDWGDLSLPGLNTARKAVAEELVELCAHDPERAREVLGLSTGQRAEVTRNAELYSTPVLPAAALYTGVLYEALGLSDLGSNAMDRAYREVLVFSGLWGAVRLSDPLPAYRCSGGVRLPRLGGLGPFWRSPLQEVVPEQVGEGLLLDLRSSAYAGMWKPKGELAQRTATVRVLQSRIVDGVEKRTVVSHFNKATKGRLLRALLQASRPATPTELAELLKELGYQVEAQPPNRTGSPWRLDVIVTEV